MQRTLQQLSLLVRRARGRAAALALGAALAPLGACTEYVEPAWETGVKSVNGTQLYYEVVGAGEPVVFLHDFALDRRMWDDQMLAFSARGYRVIRYDARGFGRSSDVDLDAGNYWPSEDLRLLLEQLNVQQSVRLVAASMGARYALDFAVSNPGRVRALVLSDLLTNALPDAVLSVWSNAVKAALTDMDQAKRLWFGSEFFLPARERPAVARHLSRMLDDYSGWHFENGMNKLEVALSPPAFQRLAEANLPVPPLLLVGQLDVPDALATAMAVQAGAAGASIQMMPGVGHFPNMEAPDDFNSLVLQFFDQPQQQGASPRATPDAG